MMAPIVLMTPSTAATMPSAGRPSAMVCSACGGCERFVMVFLELVLHRRLDLVRILQVHRHHPQRVADEVDREVVLRDAGKAREDGALVRPLDVGLQRDDALRLHRLGQQEEQRQQVAVVRRFPLRAGDDLGSCRRSS